MDLLCTSLAKSALAHSIAASALRALFGLSLSWQRTDKFKAQIQGWRRAIVSARTELVMGIVLLAAGGTGLYTKPSGLLFFLLLGVTLQGLGYLTAPVLALIAESDIRRTIPRESQDAVTEVAAVA